MKRLDVTTLPLEGLISREWLVTNGIGGFASSTPPSLNTRKYHGLLVAAMAPPVRRMVLLSRAEETVIHKGWSCALASNEYPGVIHPEGHQLLRAFSLLPFPRWAYQGEGWTIEKSLRLLRGENTVCLRYTLLAGDQPVDLELRPLFALRSMHELMYQWNGRLGAETRGHQQHRIPPTSRTPEVFFAHDGAFKAEGCWYLNTIYRREQERGYAGLEDLWMPGAVRWTLAPGHSACFVCSTDPIDLDRVLSEVDRQSATHDAIVPAPETELDALTRAADQFVVQVPQEASTDRVTAVVTKYPWAAPSGRSALIALPGLFLVTGRFAEARSLLLSFASKVREGLMPSFFPEEGGGPEYRGADISLWFIHAAYQYLRYSNDEQTIRRVLLEVMDGILRYYQRGTGLGIGTDAEGLLMSHEPGTATSWMHAKVGDWVITPRQGKPVELNALWYNAIRMVGELAERFGQQTRAQELSRMADAVKDAFNRRFWNEQEQSCYDVIDDHGPDPSVRPNQLLAISLPFAVLAIERHAKVLEKVRQELLTPMGVRTLSSHDPSYQGHYGGDVVSRDRAYHQGSAHPWLLGPLVSAYVRVHGRSEATRRDALKMIEGCLGHLQDDGMGQIGELFDGHAPHAPGGAIAAAISVAEILRCYVEDILDQAPGANASGNGRGVELDLRGLRSPSPIS